MAYSQNSMMNSRIMNSYYPNTMPNHYPPQPLQQIQEPLRSIPQRKIEFICTFTRNDPTKKPKQVPINNFPCTISGNSRYQQVNIKMPSSFNATFQIVQVDQKFFIWTNETTQLKVNDTIYLGCNDYLQLRQGDFLSLPDWRCEFQFKVKLAVPSILRNPISETTTPHHNIQNSASHANASIHVTESEPGVSDISPTIKRVSSMPPRMLEPTFNQSSSSNKPTNGIAASSSFHASSGSSCEMPLPENIPANIYKYKKKMDTKKPSPVQVDKFLDTNCSSTSSTNSSPSSSEVLVTLSSSSDDDDEILAVLSD